MIVYDPSRHSFSIDEIELFDRENNIFLVTIIPDIKTKTFAPHLLRTLKVSGELLSKDMYLSLVKKSDNDETNLITP